MGLEDHPAGLPQLTLEGILHKTGETVSHVQRKQNCIALVLHPSQPSASYPVSGN